MDEMNLMDVMASPQVEIIVLSADAIKTDDLSGTSITYTFNTTFDGTYNSPQSFGMKPGKKWMPYEVIEKIVSAPAKYIGTFGMKVGSNGKPELALKDLDYICDVKLTDIPIKSAKDDPDYPKYAPAPAKEKVAK